MAARKKKAAKKTARPRMSELNALFKGTGFETMDKAPEIVVVPSILAGYNRASGIGGIALETIHLIHGPTHAGKSLVSVCLGILSFIAKGHHPAYADAEHAADVHKWFEKLGVDRSRAGYQVPGYYEEILESAVTFLENIRAGRKDGTFPPDRAFSYVLDSLDACTPKRILDKILGRTKDKKKKFPREAGRERANAHGIFFDSITPLMAGVPFTLFALAHEKRVIKTLPGGKQYETWEVRGGNRIRGVARSQLRVTHSGYVEVKKERVAKRIRVQVKKNKMGFPDAEFCFFHATEEGAANGEPWLNLGRELVEEAMHPDTAVMEIAGGRLRWNGKSQWKEQWSKAVNEDDDLFAALWLDVEKAQRAHRERLAQKAT